MNPILAVLTAVFLSCHWAEGAHKYTIDFKKDTILEPCDLDGFTNVDTIFDLSGLNFTREDNDSIVISGHFKLHKDVGVLQMLSEAKKFDRGNWVPMATIIKSDYCLFIISPEEGAQFFFKNLEPKRCPFDTDTVYTIQPTAIDMKMDISYLNAHGEYILWVKLLNKEKNISTCAKIQYNVH